MDAQDLPPQLRPVLRALAGVLHGREPAIRERVDRLRLEHPAAEPEQLARMLIRSTRRRVASTGAASGAAAILPGLGTIIALGTTASQSLYALEQETELVLAIAMIYGRELGDSDQRLIEALVVIGVAGGAVKLRDDVLVAGGERVTIAAFRRLPLRWAGRLGGDIVARVVGRTAAQRAAAVIGRVAPLAIGMAVGAGFDWTAVTLLGRAAMRYYGSPAVGGSLPVPAPRPELRAANGSVGPAVVDGRPDATPRG